MKEFFRQSMSWLHTWTGLVAGWVLFFVFVTGSATYYYMEITRWMQPELPLRVEAQYASPAISAQTAVDFLARQPEPADSWTILLPNNGHRAGCGTVCGARFIRGYDSDLSVFWAGNSARLDSRTGTVLPPLPPVRQTDGGQLFLYAHIRLHYIDAKTGEWIVSIVSMLGLLAIITGVIVHKKIFKDFFTFRPAKGQRSWLDGHNVISVMALPFFVMIVYSGLVLQSYMPEPMLETPTFQPALEKPTENLVIARSTVAMAPIIAQAERVLGRGELGEIRFSHERGERPLITIARMWGTELPLKSATGSEVNFDAETGKLLDIPYTFGQQPGHKALWFFTITHKGWFAGAGMRWLLFVSGLLGGLMIATGLVLWTVKRREKYARRGTVPFGLPIVEKLNLGILVGLPIGIAAYFWANRLLPVTLAGRAEWETLALFLTWGWMLLYVFIRPTGKAWSEMSWLAAVVFGLLPVLNGITTDRHLGVTIPAGDWVLAGIDLTMLGFAAIFAFIAIKVRTRRLVVDGARPFNSAASAVQVLA